MSQSKIPLRIVQCAFLAICLTNSAMADPSSNRIGRYEFGYKVEGDRLVKPDQVFDDGTATYFQFQGSGSPAVPAIFRLTQTGYDLVEPRLEGPYVKVDGVAGEYIIRMGYSAGKVTFTGQDRFTSATAQKMLQAGTTPQGASGTYHRILNAARDVVSTATARFGKQNSVSETANTYATPVSGDVVTWAPVPVPAQAASSSATTAQSTSATEIIFLKNSVRLGSKDRHALRKAINEFKRNPNQRIELLARDDSEHKVGVADARLNAVTMFLIQEGVHRNLITGKTTDVVKEAGNNFVGVTLVIKPSVNEQSTPGLPQLQSASGVTRLSRPTQITGYATPGGQFGTGDVISAWLMLKQDATLEGTLTRWAAAAGWRLVWKGPLIEVTGNATIERAGFLQASEFVIEQTRKAGYAIKGTAYSNQTMVITAQ